MLRKFGAAVEAHPMSDMAGGLVEVSPRGRTFRRPAAKTAGSIGCSVHFPVLHGGAEHQRGLQLRSVVRGGIGGLCSELHPELTRRRWLETMLT